MSIIILLDLSFNSERSLNMTILKIAKDLSSLKARG